MIETNSTPTEAIATPASSLNSAAKRLRDRKRRQNSGYYDLRNLNQTFFTSPQLQEQREPVPSAVSDGEAEESTPKKPAMIYVEQEESTTKALSDKEDPVAEVHRADTAECSGHVSPTGNNKTPPTQHVSHNFFRAAFKKLNLMHLKPKHSSNEKVDAERAFFSAAKKSLILNPTDDKTTRTTTAAAAAAAAATTRRTKRKEEKSSSSDSSVSKTEPQPVSAQQLFPPQNELTRSSSTQSLPTFFSSEQQQQQLTISELKPSINNWNNVPRRRKKKRSPDQKYKRIRASWYHSIAEKNRLGAIGEDPIVFSDSDREESRRKNERRRRSTMRHFVSEEQKKAKRSLLKELNQTKGESSTPEFRAALEHLLSIYDSSHFDPRSQSCLRYVGSILEGIGISAGKPTFPGCIGYNPNGDPMYKLGTMSFDMFCPTQLVLSVQGTFVLIDTVDATNSEEVKHVPSNLLEEVRYGDTPVRTYNIVTPCTIEAYRPEFGEDSPNKEIQEPIRCVLTTYGYILPYPKGHRFSVWFTGGTLEMDGSKNEKWFQIFDKDTAPKRNLMETGKVFAAKLLMGATTNDTMDENGKLSYTLSRPMASHIDLIYLDPALQIFRGSSGTVYVHVRIPGSHAVHSCIQSDDEIPNPGNLCEDEDSDDDDDDDEDEEGSNNNKPAVPVVPVKTILAAASVTTQRRRIKSEANLQNLCRGIVCKNGGGSSMTTFTKPMESGAMKTMSRLPLTPAMRKVS